MKGFLNAGTTALLVIDIQERLMPVINNKEEVFSNANKLIKGCQILGVPIIVTEQYPKGLGHTCAEIELPEDLEVFEKICFSCMGSDVVTARLKVMGVQSLILCGAETHICVLKTALDAVKDGFDVHVVADAVSSRTPANKELGLKRMSQSGVWMASTEMVLFQLMEKAGTDQFKAISRLIK